MNVAKVSPSESGSEERGGVSRALSHLKETDTISPTLKIDVFDRLKKFKNLFLHYHWKILTK